MNSTILQSNTETCDSDDVLRVSDVDVSSLGKLLLRYGLSLNSVSPDSDIPAHPRTKGGRNTRKPTAAASPIPIQRATIVSMVHLPGQGRTIGWWVSAAGDSTEMRSADPARQTPSRPGIPQSRRPHIPTHPNPNVTPASLRSFTDTRHW